MVAISAESLRTVRDHLSQFVDRVEGDHERVIVTRNGRAAAVLISPQDLAQLEETIDVLSNSDALADIREADQAYSRGNVVRGGPGRAPASSVIPEGDYEIVLTPPAHRTLTDALPEVVVLRIEHRRDACRPL
jgi:antitoxin YefM